MKLQSLALAWVVGTLLQLQQSALWPAWVYACFMLPALVAIALGAMQSIARWRGSHRWGCPLWCAVLLVAACGWGSTGLRAVVFASHALDPALEGKDLRVTGVVADLPQLQANAVRFRLAVEAAYAVGQPEQVVPLPARMDVGWYSGPWMTEAQEVELQRSIPALQPGERWEFTLRLKAPHGNVNPYGFDYELALWEQGVQATGYVRAGVRDAAPRLLASTRGYPVAQARQAVRERIRTHVSDPQAAGLIAALVVGDQAALAQSDWDVFRATGVSHLVSISGLHITLFAWGASLLLGALWRRSAWLMLRLPAPTAALWGGVLLATAYAVFAGWGVPAQRTCLMLATVAALRWVGARWPWPAVWLLACAVVVAADPWALLQSGFWLSFVAVGVLFATNLGAAHADLSGAGGTFSSKMAGSRLCRVGQHVRAMLREQWVITVALAPLTLLLFGQVSVVGLVANALAIPWVTLVVTPLAMLGTAVPALWDVAALCIGWGMQVLQCLAQAPGATFTVAHAPLWLAVLGVLGALLLVAPAPRALRLLGAPMLLPVLLWQSPVPPHGAFELLAADIGQGNAVLVRTAHHALLYDAGPRYSADSDAGQRVLVPLLQALGTRLDTVVLSHRDADHVGGAAAVLAMQPQAVLYSSVEASHPLRTGRDTPRCEAGQQWQWDGVQFEFLHPRAQDYANVSKPNAISCVLRIRNGTRTALLTGDIEAPQEARLVADMGADLQADVLLVPHHGSKTSSTAAWLDAVAPRLALVQAGYRNRYGHPAPVVMQRYTQRHIMVLDSPHCGAVVWRSDAPEAPQCWRQHEKRYWQHVLEP